MTPIFARSLRRALAGGVFLFLSGVDLKIAASQPAHADLRDFLQTNMHFSRDEFSKTAQGQVVTKLLDSELRREVAIFGIVHISVPKAFFVAQYRSSDLFIETMNAVEVGLFSNPPKLEDVQALTLDPGDIKAIKKCKVGDCDLKMSAESMAYFRKQVNWADPDYQQQVQALFRKKMIEYVASYLVGGNSAMAEFDDQKYPLRLVNEFQDLLKKSSYLYVYAPDFHNYLEEYPDIDLPNVKNFIYWSKEGIGTKRRVISITHVSIYTPEAPTVFDVLIASKKLYASHYFEAGFGITALADDADQNEAGFYLLSLYRARIDALRHPHFGGILRRKVRGGLLKSYRNKLASVKARLEAMYQDSLDTE